MQPMTKMTVATVAFAALHSALASRTAKHAAGAVVGNARRDAGYRAFFVGQSLLTFAALIAYAVRLPPRTVYRITGPAAVLLRLGQVAGALHLLAGLREIGVARWSGASNLLAYRAGRDMPPGPVAQGPEMQYDGQLSTNGPFRWSRHPLNFSAIPIFWLTPHMTTRRLGFNIVSTVYFVLGSFHEEARLRQRYGDAYRAYADRGIPFFWPSMRATGILDDRHRTLPGAGGSNAVGSSAARFRP